MKHKITILALICFTHISAQSFKEETLPKPGHLSPFFFGALYSPTIHYGATPPNYNGKVIVFAHGYLDLNQLIFLFGNSYYQETYNEGYQAVFVATTRGKGMWRNGELLAEAIDMVTEKYQVEQVYVIAHSNGGKAAEAALICENKNEKVARVFALGTPYWGTYLANIAQLPGLNWVCKLVGIDKGAEVSTTYYCKYLLRPYMDNHRNNDPDKFVVLGASGYNNGSNFLTKAALSVTGSILYFVSGANDGVTPYSSSLRPGAEYVFERNDSRANFDHVDIALGQFSWPYVKPYIEDDNFSRAKSNLKHTPESQAIQSNYYIIQNINEYDSILLDKNSTSGMIEILHHDPKASFTVLDKNKKAIMDLKVISKEKNKSIIPISSSHLKIKSESEFIGFVRQNSDLFMTLDQTNTSDNSRLVVSFNSNQGEIPDISATNVTAIITRIATVDGTPIEEKKPKVVTFTKNKENFTYNTKSIKEEGVYSLLVNADDNNFKRSIISGFVIGNIQKPIEDENRNTITSTSTTTSNYTSVLYPSEVQNNAILQMNRYSKGSVVSISIYDLTGRRVNSHNLKIEDSNTYDISAKLQPLIKGLYILQINNEESIMFLKK